MRYYVTSHSPKAGHSPRYGKEAMKADAPVKTARAPRAAAAPKAPRQELVTAPVVAPAPIVHQVQESAGMQLLRQAVDRGANIEELDRLIQLKERMEASEAKQAFTSAMVQFKSNPPKVRTNQTGTVRPKDGKAGFEYRYADLAAVCEQVIASLAAVRVTHHWTTHQEASLVHVTCTLTHELGHSLSTTLMASPDDSGGKNRIQAIGSAVTYLRRYTLLAITGIAVESEGDDDGAGGITQDERAELRTEARQLRQRHSASDLAAGKQGKPGEELLQAARAVADKGHLAFGKYWRDLAETDRTQLLGNLGDLTERANAATGQQEPH